MKQTSLKYLLIFITLPLVYGCKTNKYLLKEPLPILSQSEVYQALASHNNDFDWYSAKADVDLDSDDVSGSGDLILRIKRDSLIWIVGKKLGIEGVRIKATPTDYAAIFRLENTYQTGSLEKLEKVTGMPIVFEDLQNLMVGNIMIPAAEEIDSFQWRKTEYYLSTIIDELDIKYYIDAFDLTLNRVKIVDQYQRVIFVNYEDYKMVDDQSFAHKVSISFDNSGQKSALVLKFKDIEINTPKNTPFSIPSHYDRVY